MVEKGFLPFIWLGSILSWVSEIPRRKAWHWVTHSLWARGPTSHLNTVMTASSVSCTVLRIFEPRGDALRFHISFQQAPTMGATSSLPCNSPLRCLLNNLDTLGLTPDIQPKNLIHFCTQIWPTYPLYYQSHWPLFWSLDPNLLWDL
jgi:hypothetical protein